MGALDRLKNKVEENNYTSNFDFASYEISDEDKAFIQEKEKNLSKCFKKHSENLKQLCEDLFEVSIKLKESNTFMAWYQANGLNKDIVSVLLKRHSLYVEFPENIPYLSSISDQAVKVLTHKDVTFEDREVIVTSRVSAVEDIKTLLLPYIEENKKEFEKKDIPIFKRPAFKAVSKLQKRVRDASDMKSLSDCKNEISEIKKALISLEKEIVEREKMEEHKNNLTLTDMEKDSPTQ